MVNKHHCFSGSRRCAEGKLNRVHSPIAASLAQARTSAQLSPSRKLLGAANSAICLCGFVRQLGILHSVPNSTSISMAPGPGKASSLQSLHRLVKRNLPNRTSQCEAPICKCGILRSPCLPRSSAITTKSQCFRIETASAAAKDFSTVTLGTVTQGYADRPVIPYVNFCKASSFTQFRLPSIATTRFSNNDKADSPVFCR